jgi:hypothetical protein
MAQEGLFFTGTVLKNNRNLLQEEAARQQLAMQQEMLNLRKQEAADRRKKDRKDGRKSSSVEANYEGISDPRLKLYMTQQARELSRFMGDNYDSEDPMILSEIEDRKNNLRLFTEYAKGLDTKIVAYNPLNKDASNLRYQTDEDGNNMIDVNKQAIFASLQDGTFDLQSRIASFEDDFDGQVIQDETTPGYMGFLTDMESESFIGADGNTYKGLDPGEKTQFLNDFKGDHLINPNTRTFPSTQAEKDYMTNERFEIDGNVYDGIGAYLLEREGLRDEPSAEERERFNPKSEFFDEKLHTDYVNYLGEKIWSRETANRNTLLTRVKPEEEDDKNKLSQDRIDFFMSDSEETEPYGLSELKVSPNFGEDITDAGIVVSLTKASPIKEQGEVKLQEFNDLFDVANSEGTDVPVQGKVSWVGITVSGKTVARVEFSGQSFLIDLADISSEQQEVKSGSTTALDLFKLAGGGVTTESSKGVGSKYNKQ